jgi:hypothetical protein
VYGRIEAFDEDIKPNRFKLSQRQPTEKEDGCSKSTEGWH